MNIFKHGEWERISAQKKIVYYPEFYYGAVVNDKQAMFDTFFIEDKLRTHLFHMKLLLLYFHYISMPFCNFYIYFDNIYSYLYNALFKNNDFRELVSSGLIIYELRSKYDSLSYFERYESELKQCGFNNVLTLSDDLRKIFIDLLIVERDTAHLTRSYELQKKIESTVSKNFLENDVETIKKAMDKSQTGGNAFMSEIFVYELKSSRYRDLRSFIANNYLEISETTNYHTLTYTPANNSCFGSLLRKNTMNNVYAFLYSPDFFELFLSLFIDLKNEINIYNLTLKDIMLIRSYDFWNDFVYEYHEIITKISRCLDFTIQDNIYIEARKALINELNAGRLQRSGLLLSKSLLDIGLNALKVPVSTDFLSEVTNFEKAIPLLNLNKKYSATRNFLRLLLSLMRH